MAGARVQRGEALEAWGTVGELLATGHFAAFYRVEEASKPLVAEVLVEDFVRMPAVAEAFLAEARRWSAVKHASLATPVGLGRTASGQPFAVGETIDGIPLAAYIAQGQRFPPISSRRSCTSSSTRSRRFTASAWRTGPSRRRA